MRRRVVIAGLVLCGTAGAQQQQFEVASIRPSQADVHGVSGIKTGHGKLEAHNVTLKRCLMGAYGVGPHQIVGGPGWLDSDRFEILATAELPSDDDAVFMRMLQGLLQERFKLVAHHESRTMPALVLEVGKGGPKIQKSATPGEAGTSTTHTNSSASIEARHADMEGFARSLARTVDLPVVNRTGLDGMFDFKLHWIPDNAKTDEPPLSIFTAIQEQLGLRLRAEKAPIDVLVIDRVELPTAN